MVSCGKKTLIDETHNFKNNCWLRFNPEVYRFDVNNTNDSHCIALTLRYDTNVFNASELPLVVDFFIDSNEMHNFFPTLRLRDAKGSLRGTAIGNYCTVTDTIDSRRIYNNKGSYTYRIKQGTSKYELYGISSLTLTVTR